MEYSDFYTQQSPVFAADKVTTPLLLIYGDADANVPVGESHQIYTALKLLEKDAELIELQGDDYHINSRGRRLRWLKTVLSYFDMKFKISLYGGSICMFKNPINKSKTDARGRVLM